LCAYRRRVAVPARRTSAVYHFSFLTYRYGYVMIRSVPGRRCHAGRCSRKHSRAEAAMVRTRRRGPNVYEQTRTFRRRAPSGIPAGAAPRAVAHRTTPQGTVASLQHRRHGRIAAGSARLPVAGAARRGPAVDAVCRTAGRLPRLGPCAGGGIAQTGGNNAVRTARRNPRCPESNTY
jgi:hypothetical protein